MSIALAKQVIDSEDCFVDHRQVDFARQSPNTRVFNNHIHF